MNNILNWLLSGDQSIAYQASRDLHNTDKKKLNRLKKKIINTGWGRQFLDKRNNETGLWGNGIYSPKWISTTYTMLDLKNIGLPPDTKNYIESGIILINKLWKIPQKKKDRYMDLCVCGMLLNLCCYAKIDVPKIKEIIDFILDKQFDDGGWNCRWLTDKKHSSLHTTINILEGLKEYLESNHSYKKKELFSSIKKAHEFILMHNLFKSDKTKKIIHKNMTMLSYPTRWQYDILRCMDYFQSVNVKYDRRMDDALEIIIKKKLKNNRWPVQMKHAGLVHFDMEKTGKESRWNTLRALRVLKKYRKDIFRKIFH